MTVQVVHDSTSSYGEWKVIRNGRKISNHRKKSAAIKKMKQKANNGEQMIVQNRNGRYARGYPKKRRR